MNPEVEELLLEGQEAFGAGHVAWSDDCCRRVLELNPGNFAARLGLAMAQEWRGRYAEAAAALRELAAERPDDARPWEILGLVDYLRGDVDGAEAAWRRAAEVGPGSRWSSLCLSDLLLSRGRYAEGFSKYEARLTVRAYRDLLDSPVGMPRWYDEPLRGKRLLVLRELGAGDQVLVVRFARLLADRGARVIWECDRPLRRLFETVDGIEQVVAVGERRPAVDYWVAGMSLPRLLGASPETAASSRYVSPDPVLVEAWAPYIPPWPEGLNVGVLWAGDRDPDTPSRLKPRRDEWRDMPAAALEPLGRIPGVRWFSLQLGRHATPRPPGMKVYDISGGLHDFAETAAALSRLDAFITVDTGPANLAGAMGIPTWVMLPTPCEWRWTSAGDSTPWYPSARLFRQPSRGDWPSVVERVAAELARLSAERRAGRYEGFGIGTAGLGDPAVTGQRAGAA